MILPRFHLGRIAIFMLLSISLNGLFAQTPLYTSHWDTSADPDLTSGSAGAVSTATFDTTCSQVTIQVTDTATAPLPAFSAYIINPKDSMGADIADLSGNMRIYFRAKSRETVELSVLLRSGGGTSGERSDRVTFTVPGDTSNWSMYVFEFTAANLAGFDSTDLRDLWFYLDRGVNNFAGNEFYIDYLSIGEAPDPSANSSCSFLPPVEFPYIVHWADTADRVLSGTGAVQLSQTIDPVCSQLAVSVIDPVGDPLAAFRPLIINPADPLGNDIADLSGQMTFTVRIRSAEEILLGMLLRAGDGTMPFRTETIEQIVPGDLTKWTEVEFTFTGTNYAGFDSTDLRDLWLYFDRESPNFNGNEVYIDYVSIGSRPDTAQDSDCVQSVGMEDDLAITGMKLYPNPSQQRQSVQVAFLSETAASYRIEVYNMMGNLVRKIQTPSVVGEQAVTIDSNNLPSGMYLIQVVGANKKASLPWIIQ